VCLSVRATNEAAAWGRLAFRATFQQVKFVTLSVASFPTEQVQGAGAFNTAPEAATAPGGPITPLSAMSPAPPVLNQPQTVTSAKPLFTPQPTPATTSTPPLLNHGATGSWSFNTPPNHGASGGW
jgi:hypothetical protein